MKKERRDFVASTGHLCNNVPPQLVFLPVVTNVRIFFSKSRSRLVL